MENENVQAQDSNSAEEVTLEVTEETADNSQNTAEESVEEVKARLAKAEELAKNYKVRAEKAEKLAKSVKVETKPEAKNDKLSVSTRDYLALVNAKVNEEDITEVEEYARFKGVSIADALKSSVVKTLLSEKEEMRKTANAANVNNVRKSVSKVSGEVLLDKASKGEMLDDVDALVKARLEAKRAK
jgi:hypothetical protein